MASLLRGSLGFPSSLPLEGAGAKRRRGRRPIAPHPPFGHLPLKGKATSISDKGLLLKGKATSNPHNGLLLKGRATSISDKG